MRIVRATLRSLPAVRGAPATSLMSTDITIVTASTLTLTSSHSRKLLIFNSASSQTVTVPAGLTDSEAGFLFSCSWLQYGAGQVTFQDDGTSVLVSPYDYFKSATRYAQGGIFQLPSDLDDDLYAISGELEA